MTSRARPCSNALTEEETGGRSKSGNSATFEIDGGRGHLAIGRGARRPQSPSPEEGTGERPGDAADAAGPSGRSQTLESRRQAARQVRRRVQELSNVQVERLALLLLARSGYREPRQVRLAGGEHERLFVVRRKLGLTEFRFLCQVLLVGREVSRENLQLLREWLPEAEAHAAMVVGPGEATREARAESLQLGQPLLTLMCGDAFIEELVLRQVGVLTFEAVAVDDLFWRNFRRTADLKPKHEGSPRVHQAKPAIERDDATASPGAPVAAVQSEAAAETPGRDDRRAPTAAAGVQPQSGLRSQQ